MIEDQDIALKLFHIATIYGLNFKDLFSKSKKQLKCDIRNAIIEILNSMDNQKYSYANLAKIFNRDRTTIYDCIKTSKLNRILFSKNQRIYEKINKILNS